MKALDSECCSNILQSLGWSTLHFTTKELTTNLDHTLSAVQESIARYGGLWHPEPKRKQG